MYEQVIQTLSCSAIAVTILMILVWLESLRRRDASIVDCVWGLGFAVVSWVAYGCATERSGVSMLLPVLTSVWGVRLSAYLTWRNHGKPEDYRYRAMREKWGESFPLVSLITVYGLQGVVMWIVSLPVQVGAVSATHVTTPLLVAGIGMWAIGLGFETIGDWQLKRFKSNPENQGRVLDTGLWRYTRHPNYFGDALVWWGLFLVGYSTSGAWWSVVSPIVMTILLMKVSGVTLLEESLRKTKSGYESYVARTNAFFPGPPRSK
jgi:steroid 5-alpha reductase family enzyme